ncbi:MAG: DNA repair protein RecN [Chlamydiales bacterium]|nr:DNA repair protein RecN [Chlamydiales bacterium]
MLKHLSIKNIALVDHLEIPFESGFNVLTGETGAGKSAVMQAIKLALGSRGDSSLIRKHETKGSVTAVFDIDGYHELLQFLKETGIEHNPSEFLIIQRELNDNGKNRSFINHQLAQVSLVEKVGSYLVDIAAQHAYQRLFSLDAHLSTLDTFCKTSLLLSDFQKTWRCENETREKLNILISGRTTRDEKLSRLKNELEDITKANIQEGEDEELFQEYTRLLKDAERVSKAREILETFDSRISPLTTLAKQKTILEDLVNMDTSLTESLKTLETVLIELNELSYTLNRYQESLESNPKQEAFLDARLTLINQIKKKYGPSVADIFQYRETIRIQIEEMDSLEEMIASLQNKLLEQEISSDKLARALTEKRRAQIPLFEELVQNEIRSLNMPKACFHVEMTSKARNFFGDEKVEFKFAPNVGERILSLKESASGGELSRVLLALKTVLADVDKVPTLIFDEIDANVGGETATIVGQKLSLIGTKHQVLCITHLPQVAHLAHHHFQITKYEKEDRTVTNITFLDKENRQRELSRMLGGKIFSETLLNEA